MNGVGHEVRRLRKARGWNQAKLAVEANMAPSAVNQIENGKRNPGATSLEKLAKALGVEVADLFPKAQSPLSFDDPERMVRWRLYLHVRPWIYFFEELTQRWEEAAEPGDFDRDTYEASVQVMTDLFRPYHKLWDALGDEAWTHDANLSAWDTKAGKDLDQAYERLYDAWEKLIEASINDSANRSDIPRSEVPDLEQFRRQRAERHAALEQAAKKKATG